MSFYLVIEFLSGSSPTTEGIEKPSFGFLSRNRETLLCNTGAEWTSW